MELSHLLLPLKEQHFRRTWSCSSRARSCSYVSENLCKTDSGKVKYSKLTGLECPPIFSVKWETPAQAAARIKQAKREAASERLTNIGLQQE
ncbi:MAG: hypothetical protein WBL88_08260 [Nitrososphaeraceae archaeon]